MGLGQCKKFSLEAVSAFPTVPRKKESQLATEKESQLEIATDT